MKSFLWHIAKDVRGASAAEYALILAIIGAAIAIGSITLGASIADSMNDATSNISQ